VQCVYFRIKGVAQGINLSVSNPEFHARLYSMLLWKERAVLKVICKLETPIDLKRNLIQATRKIQATEILISIKMQLARAVRVYIRIIECNLRTTACPLLICSSSSNSAQYSFRIKKKVETGMSFQT
jgi:hypothetical protein